MSILQVARFSSFATSLLVVLALTFEHLFATESSTPRISCRNPVYVWLIASSQGGINEPRIDVRRWTRACLKYQLTKVQCNTVSPLATFTPPDSGFSHVHLDLVGPLPSSQSSRYMLTCVDRFTRWPEALSLNRHHGRASHPWTHQRVDKPLRSSQDHNNGSRFRIFVECKK
ncbi:hypothetical protein MRX96_000380 [Rhipicephalus microplus]